MHASRPSREPAAEEISIEPGPPLQGLQRRILAQDPGLARDAASLDAGADALRLVTEQDVALLLLHAPADLLDTGRPGPDLAVIMAQAVCDVALLVPGDVAAGGAVLVPFAGHEHDWAALELGACLAAAHGAPLRLTGVEARAGAGARDASRLLRQCLARAPARPWESPPSRRSFPPAPTASWPLPRRRGRSSSACPNAGNAKVSGRPA